MDFAIDLETLGRVSGCPIVSIGCVSFERDAEGTNEELYLELNLGEQFNEGYKVDANTLAWWMQQENRDVFLVPDSKRKSLEDALLELRQFVTIWGDDGSCVWAIGSDFDIAMLRWMYSEWDINWPFHYQAARDVRTLCDARGYDRKTLVIPGLMAHNALDDAIYAATCVQHAFKHGK